MSRTACTDRPAPAGWSAAGCACSRAWVSCGGLERRAGVRRAGHESVPVIEGAGKAPAGHPPIYPFGYLLRRSASRRSVTQAAIRERELKPSLRRMFSTWPWAVRTEITRRAAISGLDRPSATRSATSSSRLVSGDGSAGAGGGAASVVSSMANRTASSRLSWAPRRSSSRNRSLPRRLRVCSRPSDRDGVKAKGCRSPTCRRPPRCASAAPSSRAARSPCLCASRLDPASPGRRRSPSGRPVRVQDDGLTELAAASSRRPAASACSPSPATASAFMWRSPTSSARAMHSWCRAVASTLLPANPWQTPATNSARSSPGRSPAAATAPPPCRPDPRPRPGCRPTPRASRPARQHPEDRVSSTEAATSLPSSTSSLARSRSFWRTANRRPRPARGIAAAAYRRRRPTPAPGSGGPRRASRGRPVEVELRGHVQTGRGAVRRPGEVLDGRPQVRLVETESSEPLCAGAARRHRRRSERACPRTTVACRSCRPWSSPSFSARSRPNWRMSASMRYRVWAGVGRLGDDDRLVDQCAHHVEDGVGGEVVGGTNRGNGPQVASADEHRGTCPQPLLDVGEHRWKDQSTQALSDWCRAPASRKPMVSTSRRFGEALADLLRREHPDPGGGQLDGQRNSRGGHGTGRRRPARCPASARSRTVPRWRDRRTGGPPRSARWTSGVAPGASSGRFERWDNDDVLPAEPERPSARRAGT